MRLQCDDQGGDNIGYLKGLESELSPLRPYTTIEGRTRVISRRINLCNPLGDPKNSGNFLGGKHG
jgi:hypothetical protein